MIFLNIFLITHISHSNFKALEKLSETNYLIDPFQNVVKTLEWCIRYVARTLSMEDMSGFQHTSEYKTCLSISVYKYNMYRCPSLIRQQHACLHSILNFQKLFSECRV